MSSFASLRMHYCGALNSSPCCAGAIATEADTVAQLESSNGSDPLMLDRVRRRMFMPGASTTEEDFALLFRQCRSGADQALQGVEARERCSYDMGGGHLSPRWGAGDMHAH